MLRVLRLRRSLYLVGGMIFFWSIFDSMISYIIPVVVTQEVYSKTLMGIILGSSSIFGAAFDIGLSRVLKNTNFRRIYLMMIALCFAMPLVLLNAKTIWMYLLAMAIWGLYYDLAKFGSFDYVSRRVSIDEHSSGFGIISMFKSLGYLVGPIIVGFFIGEVIDVKPFILAWIFIGLTLLFYVLFLYKVAQEKKEYIDTPVSKVEKFNIFTDMSTWRKLGKFLFPVLAFTMLLNIFDAFFWTVGPLLSESLSEIHPFGGFIIAAYMLPSVLIGLFVGRVTKRFGGKRSAYISLFLGGIFILGVGFVENPLLVVLVILVSSIFTSVSWPAIEGVYADFITDAPELEREVEGIEDFFSNLGYVFGPIMAGFLADQFGNGQAFTVLGVITIIAVLIILKITPRKITLKPSVIEGN